MKRRIFIRLLVLLSVPALVLAACGGDGSNNDGVTPPPPDGNHSPTADAGTDQVVYRNDVVELNAGASSDADGDNLFYVWALTNKPPGSSAVLSGGTTVSPSFTADKSGPYQVGLVVNDGKADSAVDTVIITATKAWGTRQLIESRTEVADGDPKLAVDPSGNALAVWEQRAGVNNHIYANRYDMNTATWGTEDVIESSPDLSYTPHIGVDASGNAVTVWMRQENFEYNAYANHYDAQAGVWGTEGLIENTASGVADPRVAVAANGDAVAVWVTNKSVYAVTYDSQTGAWGTERIIENSTESALAPEVAVDANGNAVVVWYSFDASWNYSLYANRYVSATGTWVTEVPMVTGLGDYDLGAHHVAMDADGNALVVWAQRNPTYYDIHAVRYDTGTDTWGTAEIIEAGAKDAGMPQAAFDAGGNAMVVWTRFDGSYYSVYANRYVVASDTWTGEALVETDTEDALTPRVAIDAGGNAMVVWKQYVLDVFEQGIFANYYDAGTGLWAKAIRINTGNAGYALPEVALDAGGNAVAVWRQSDGAVYSIYANHFK